MFSVFVIGLCCITAVYASISGRITSGSCVCLTTSGENASHDPGLHGTVAGLVKNGECYIFNGQILTTNGYTWYQLQHVNGGLVWVAGNFLQISKDSNCTKSGTASRRATQQFESGLVSQNCMQCICNRESNGCTRLECKMDRGSLSCGYFQIKHDYWVDCGSLGTSWESCARDLQCASLCVQKYMARYIGYYHCDQNCESYARTHNGGTNGCKRSTTLDYWRLIQNEGCSTNS